MSLLKINIAGAKRAAARVHRSVPSSPPPSLLLLRPRQECTAL